MKKAINDFRVTTENQNKILRVTFESTIEIRGVTFPNTFLEPIDNKFIPYDENVYYVPAILHYSDKTESQGYIYYIPQYAMNQANLIIKNDKQIVLNFDSVSAEFLYPPEGFSPEIFEESKSLPAEVEWANFNEENSYTNVAYAFRLIGSEEVDIDPNYLKVRKELSGDFDEDDDMELIEAFRPKFMLHKVFLNKIPEIGTLFYLPIEITFNSKQKSNGYALYDVGRKQVLDLHICDKEFGQVSALYNHQKLEDMGLFVDEETFSYRLLLSDIQQ